jgi:hypothetical protein
MLMNNVSNQICHSLSMVMECTLTLCITIWTTIMCVQSLLNMMGNNDVI